MFARHLLAAAAMVALGSAHAASVTVASASSTGTVNNAGSLATTLNDGDFGLGTWWTDAPNTWWTHQEGAGGAVLTLTFDKLYTLTDVRIGQDNNDFYAVQVSTNGTQWNTLFTSMATYVDPSFVYSGASMIQRSSDSTAGASYSSLIDFAPTQARYARVYAVYGDQSYAVSELSFTGTAVPVPEPQSWALLAAGLGLVGSLARRRQAR